MEARQPEGQPTYGYPPMTAQQWVGANAGGDAESYARDLAAWDPADLTWTIDDGITLGSAVHWEATLRYLAGDLAKYGPPGERQRVRELLADYHAALPFTAAELDWLEDTLPDPEIPPDIQERSAAERASIRAALPDPDTDPNFWHHEVDALAGVKAEIDDGGVTRPVDGSELLRRWWEWRRQTGQFEATGRLDATIAALRALDDLLYGKTD